MYDSLHITSDKHLVIGSNKKTAVNFSLYLFFANIANTYYKIGNKKLNYNLEQIIIDNGLDDTFDFNFSTWKYEDKITNTILKLMEPDIMRYLSVMKMYESVVSSLQNNENVFDEIFK